MKFWFRGHHYHTQFKTKLTQGYCKWFGHEDDCCDYWTPIDDPRAQRALMLDDDFKLTKKKGKP